MLAAHLYIINIWAKGKQSGKGTADKQAYHIHQKRNYQNNIQMKNHPEVWRCGGR